MWRRARVLGLVVLGLAGCGDDQRPPWEPAAWHNGTRLRARVVDAGGGAVQFDGWYDTELGITCAFRLMTDGGMQCLPFDVGTVERGDETCGSFVVASSLDASCPAPAFWVDKYLQSSCGPWITYDVGFVGASRGVAPIYYDDGFACQAYVGEWPTFEPAFSRVRPTFVAAEVVEFERPGGVIARVALAADGAEQVLELVNPGGDICKPVDFLDGAGWRCVVAAAVRPDIFDGRDCITPAPPISGGCGRPEVLVAADGHVYLPGEARVGDVFTQDGERCTSLGLRNLWQNGAPADASAFPSLAVTELGAGAVRARFTTDARGNVLMPAGLFDPATGTACRPTAEDGATDTAPWRCLPIDVPLATSLEASLEAFTDRACTIPAGPLVASHTYGALHVAHVADVVCDYRHPAPLRGLFDVRIHVDPIYQLAGSACREVDHTAAGYLYDVVAERPLTSLPALTIRVE